LVQLTSGKQAHPGAFIQYLPVAIFYYATMASPSSLVTCFFFTRRVSPPYQSIAPTGLKEPALLFHNHFNSYQSIAPAGPIALEYNQIRYLCTHLRWFPL